MGWSEALESWEPWAILSVRPDGAVSSVGWAGILVDVWMGLWMDSKCVESLALEMCSSESAAASLASIYSCAGRALDRARARHLVPSCFLDDVFRWGTLQRRPQAQPF